MATPLYHLTTGQPVNVHMEGGGMRYRPQKRMSYAQRLLLAQAERAEKDAEAAAEFEKDPRRCLAQGPDGDQCKGYRIKGGLYCSGHNRSAKRRAFHHQHEEFTEALPLTKEAE